MSKCQDTIIMAVAKVYGNYSGSSCNQCERLHQWTATRTKWAESIVAKHNLPNTSRFL
jgi:hypothetical protein